ncbi:GNAT family N-acetyltransferase [Salinispira pacifica]
MTWKIVREETLPHLVSYLSPLEWGCVSFTSRLLVDGEPQLPSRRTARICVLPRPDDGDCGFEAAVLQTSHGFYYPVFDGADPLGNPTTRTELRRALRLPTARVYSIMGRRGDVESLGSLFAKPTVHEIDYYLMVQERPGSFDRKRLPEGLTFRRATGSDAGYLFPLQRDYEKEEVLLPGDRFDSTASMHHFRASLLEQLVYVAELDGAPVAKAGTNARGFRFDQIGGVFTRRDLRGRGVGAALMTRLMQEINRDGRSCCLFVKQHNAPAIAMYTRLGYLIRDDFRIVYY